MKTLKSLVAGQWIAGSGPAQHLVNPATEEVIAEVSAQGLDLPGAVSFAREKGRPGLAEMSMAQRAGMLAEMARRMHEHRDALIELGMANGGGTRGDTKFDLDGASATLAHYAEIGKELGDARYLVDGEAAPVGRSPRLIGRHIYVPRPGVAVLINAFNFPAWGFGEKAACALLAGMPVIVKPAVSTALLTHRILELVADAAPEGAITLVGGSAHDLPTLLDYGDVISFTGSSHTGKLLSGLPRVMDRAVRLNIEADSLNSAVLGPDVEEGSDTFELFLRDVVKEMTQKAGQKCTAIRRIFVPEAMRQVVRDILVERLESVVVGNPTSEGVRMGPLTTAKQQQDVISGIGQLAEGARLALDGRSVKPRGVADGKGYFVGPTLVDSDSHEHASAHALEVFGPVATLMPSADSAMAQCEVLGKGAGGLVCSLYTDDRKYAAEMLAGAAPHHGRLVFGSKKIAGQAPTPGTVMPQLLHGGPGRAGDGQELGGLRGLALYSQRTAIQGDGPMIEAMLRRPKG